MIYLDNASTSYPKAPGVSEAVARCLDEVPGSAGRASHAYALAADEILYEARLELARFLGAAFPERLVFTKSATESLNLVILGALPAGGRVLVSSLEHNAVMRPLRYLEKTRGLSVDVFPCDAAGSPDFAALEAGLGVRPDLLVITAASNVTGAILPLPAILALAKAASVPSLVDGSQFVGHRPLDLASLGPDYFAFSAHKGLLGPAGLGGLYLSPGREPEPLIRGGTGSASASEDQPGFLPDRYEAGTHNIAGLAGLRAALAFLNSQGLDRIAAREGALASRLRSGLEALAGLRILGPEPGTSMMPVIACVSDEVPESDLALELDRRGIALRLGLQCAPAAHRSIGSLERGGTLRFSPGYFTREDEIDLALETIEEILS